MGGQILQKREFKPRPSAVPDFEIFDGFSPDRHIVVVTSDGPINTYVEGTEMPALSQIIIESMPPPEPTIAESIISRAAHEYEERMSRDSNLSKAFDDMTVVVFDQDLKRTRVSGEQKSSQSSSSKSVVLRRTRRKRLWMISVVTL